MYELRIEEWRCEWSSQLWSLKKLKWITKQLLSINQMSTWDFSTLRYTSLPHAKCKHLLHDLFEPVFNTRGNSFIAINNFHSFWANDRKSTKYTYFSCSELCIDDLFSINNPNFWNHISTIYPSELEPKETTFSSNEVCYLQSWPKTLGHFAKKVNCKAVAPPPPHSMFISCHVYYSNDVSRYQHC